jgi:hypothetical protein
MSLKTLVAEAITEIEKLLTHTDPAVTAQAQTVAGKLEAIKTEVVADAEKIGHDAEDDGRNLLGEAEGDITQIAEHATGAPTPQQ